MKPDEMKTEFRNLVAELKESVRNENKDAQDKINARLDELEELKSVQEKIDDFELKLQSMGKPASVDKSEKKAAVAQEFYDAARDFAKGNRGEMEKKAYTKSAKSTNMVRFDYDSAGALVLPDEISTDIIREAIEATPVTQLVRVTQTSAPVRKRYVRTSTPGVYWIEEEEEAPKGKPTYKTINIELFKAAARYGMSIEQQEDTAFNLIQEITDAYREDFSYSIGNAVVAGDGNKKPTGIIGNVQNFNSGSLALDPDTLIRLQESLKENYHANGQWLFTRDTRANIRTLVLSNDAYQYLWEPNFQTGAPTLLLGKPINIASENDLAGKVSGNFTSGQVPVLYGDFSQAYEMTRGTEMYMIDDIYSESSNFVRNMAIMSRVGGKVVKPEALAQLTMTS